MVRTTDEYLRRVPALARRDATEADETPHRPARTVEVPRRGRRRTSVTGSRRL